MKKSYHLEKEGFLAVKAWKPGRLILPVLLCLVFSANALAQEMKTVTIANNDISFKELFAEIERQVGYTFFYNNADIDVEQQLNVNVTNKSVEALLKEVLPANLQAQISSNQITLVRQEPAAPQTTPQRQIRVSGKVTDTNGEALIGAAVAVVGTTIGALSDVDGNSVLNNVPSGGRLQVSYIGYNTVIVDITGRTTINVTLEPETQIMDEVVVIGYGTQKKSNVTGAISSVRSSDLQNLSITNAAAAVQGKTAGVQVMNTSGAPGSTATLRIRGFSSNGVSDPLYIVDGLKVPNLNFLDPDNIESMEILKDAASAAIYGAEAGNGVVLVTTKTGKKGEGKIFVNTQNSFLRLANRVELLNAEDFIQYAIEYSPAKAEELNTYYYNDPTSYVNNKLADTDWQDLLFDTGYRQRYSVGFQGGNDRGSLYVSLNILDHNGIITGSYDSFKRLTGQLNADYQIKEWFGIGITNSIETSKMKQVSESSILLSNTTSQLYEIDPLTPLEYSDGLTGTPVVLQDAVEQGWQPLINPETGNYYGYSRWTGSNPISSLLLGKDNYSDVFQVNGTLYGNLTPLKNLVFTSRLGYRLYNVYSYSYRPPYWQATETALSKSPSLTATQSGMLYYQWENFVNYSLQVKQQSLSIMAGMSYINSKMNYVGGMTDGLTNLNDNFHYLNYSSSTATDYLSGATTLGAQIAYYGRLTWDFADRYNLQINFRADSYDAAYLDLEHNWGYFPSVSAGWTITNEPFMQNRNRNLLTFAKLRASYGVNGSISNLGGYMYSSSLSTGFMYHLNDQLYTGIFPTQYLANPNLRWEESVQMDFGLDLRFLKDRLNFTADYFNKDTDGLLVRSTANLTTGTSYVWQNVGLVNNHGFEFELGWKDEITNKLQYSIRGNLATISNIVSEYKGEGLRIEGASASHGDPLTFFEEGYPIWYIRGYVVDHIDAANGQPVYKNFDDNPEITDADRTMLGSGIPKFTYGANISLSYANFDLTAYGTGAYGNNIDWAVVRSIPLLRNKPQFLFDDRWTPEKTNAKYAKPLYWDDKKYTCSDAFVFDGSYFKIKQIQLGYNVPASLLNKIAVSSLRIYVSLDDYFTFTNYPGIDPEVRAGSTSAMAVDYGGYPIAKSMLFGLNLTF